MKPFPRWRLRSSGARVAYAFAHVTCSLAGAAAEAIRFGSYEAGSCSGDMRDAERMLKLAPHIAWPRRPDLSTELARQLLNAELFSTFKFLRRALVWRAVRRVAVALVERRSLTQAEVLRLVRGPSGRSGRTTAALARRSRP